MYVATKYIGLKWTVTLVSEYSFGFQKYSEYSFTRRSGRMAIHTS